jgi:hypothetical protein
MDVELTLPKYTRPTGNRLGVGGYVADRAQRARFISSELGTARLVFQIKG